MPTLTVEKRDIKQALNKAREQGKMPAVFYGRKEASTPVFISQKDFLKVWKQAGETTVIDLKGEDIEIEALIHDVDLHPVTGQPLHADFYAIEKGKKLEVSVPLEFVGVAPAVKDLAGTLVKVLHELEITALPKDLPREINVDISSLATLESQIEAREIKLPPGVELITKPEEIVAAISVTKEEVEEPAKSIEDIEVVGEKKEGEEGEEAASGEEKE